MYQIAEKRVKKIREEDFFRNGAPDDFFVVPKKIDIREFDAGQARFLPARGEKNEHRGSRADEERVDVDARGLNEALLYGVGRVGRGGGVRDRTHTGFVREEAALHARHDGHRKARAEHGVEVEGVTDDFGEHRRNHLDVEDRDDRGHAAYSQ